MIKFGQFVRASVMSLTLGCGLLCAGAANAYTYQELAAAEADVYSWENTHALNENNYNYYLGEAAGLPDQLNQRYIACGQAPNPSPDCWLDAVDWYDDAVFENSINLSYWQDEFYYSQGQLASAVAWRDHVAANLDP